MTMKQTRVVAVWLVLALCAWGLRAHAQAPAPPPDPGPAAAEPAASAEVAAATPPEFAPPRTAAPLASPAPAPAAPAETAFAPAAPATRTPVPAGASPDQGHKGEDTIDHTPELSGYIQVYYKARIEQDGDHKTDPGVFRFGRVKVQVSGAVMRHLTYVVEIDPRSPQLAGVIRDCYIAWEFLHDQSLRVGQMKTPFGWENRTSSADLYTVNRTEVGERFGRGLTLRDLGVGLFGHVPLGNGFRIEDEVTLTNGAGLAVQEDDDSRKNIFGRLGVRWKTKPVTLSLGVSGATGTMNEPAEVGPPPVDGVSFDFKRMGADLEADTQYAFAVFEYAIGREKASDPEEGGNLHAYYMLVAGKTPWDVGPVLRYDDFDAVYRRWTMGVYYGLPREVFRAMATYEVVHEGGRHDDRVLLWTQVRF